MSGSNARSREPGGQAAVVTVSLPETRLRGVIFGIPTASRIRGYKRFCPRPPPGALTMSTKKQSDSSQSVAARSKKIYEERLNSNLEPAHRDEFVAIEPDSGDFFLGRK